MTIQGAPDLGKGIRLHLNENTGGCSQKVVEAVRSFDAQKLALYPDYAGAVTDTAAFFGVDPERVILTNGLDEGLLLTSVAYLTNRAPEVLVQLGAGPTVPSGMPEVLVTQPSFEPYSEFARAMGARVVTVPRTPDYSYPLDAVLRAITPNTRIVYVNNPNNPTGIPIPKDVIHKVAREAGHAVVFVDEAYHDFLGENFLAEAAGYPNVVIGRTFSKAYGLAGIRVGVIVAPPDILEPIRKVLPLFNMNVVALAALRAAIKDQSFRAWYLAQVSESKTLVYKTLDKLGLKYWRSSANFVLIDGGDRARPLVDGMIAKGIFVKDRTSDPACPNCFRLTTGVIEHTRKAVEALEALCGPR